MLKGGGVLEKVKKMSKNELKEIFSELVWISRYAKKYAASIAFFVIAGIIGIAFGLMSGLVSRTLIDTVTGSAAASIKLTAVIYVIMGILRVVFRSVNGRYSEKIRLRIYTEMRSSLYKKIANAFWEDIADFSTGDLLNRLNDDTSAVSTGITGVVPVLVMRLIQFVASFGIIFYFDPVMALLSLISVPLSVICSRLLIHKMRSHSMDIRNVNSRTMSFSEDSLKNLYQIKTFGIVGLFVDEYLKLQEEYKALNLKFNKVSVITGALVALLGQAVSYVCFAWSIYRLWNGEITFGTMTLFLQLAGSLSAAFSEMVNIIPTVISSATAAGRMRRIMELKAEKRVQGHEDKIPDGALGVGFEGVSFAYKGAEPILRNVNLEIKPGEKIVITGLSGEGKTTLLRLLVAVVNPQEGLVYIRGKGDERIEVSAATRKLFCSVSQNNILFSGTLAQNMRMINPDATDEQIMQALERARAGEFIRGLPDGIYSAVGEGGCSFSEGQAQRLSIARAMLSDARILLFDEATSALDPKTEKAVMENIALYCRDKTCIFTTHRQSVVDFCDVKYVVSGSGVVTV